MTKQFSFDFNRFSARQAAVCACVRISSRLETALILAVSLGLLSLRIMVQTA